MKQAMIRVLRGGFRVILVMYAITTLFFGISYLGFASQNNLDGFWSIGWVAWIFLVPYYALGVAIVLLILWGIGEKSD